MNWKAFFRGMGSVLCLFPHNPPFKPLKSQSSEEAIADTWLKTGNHMRKAMGLPEQHKAWLIDEDGTKHYHYLDLTHGGEPRGQVKIRTIGTDEANREYQFAGKRDGYLIYRENFDHQHECGDCGWVGDQANFCPQCGSSFVKHWSWWTGN